MKIISLSRNVMFGFLSWLLPLGFTFLLTPIIVHGLGAEMYGLYALVMGFVAYSFTFNVGRAITKYVAAFHANNDTERVGEVLSNTLIINLVIGIGSAGALALSANILVTKVLNIAPALQGTAKVAFYLASIALLLTMLSQVFSAVPQAVQRFDVYSLITTIIAILTIGGNGALVWFGFGANALITWNVVITGLACAIYYFASRRLLPDARLTFRIKRDLVFSILRFSGAVIVYQLLANLLLLFERGWLTHSLGPAAVTYYVVPMTIGIYIHTLISSLTLVLFPLASEAGARRDAARLYQVYTRAYKYICVIVVFLSMTAAVGSWQLLSNWLGNDFASHAAAVLTIQAVVFGVLSLQIIPWQIADGLGFPWLGALLSLWWLLSTASLAIFLTPRMGIQGMALSRLLPMIVAPFFILVVERIAFGRFLWEFWRRTCFALILAGGTAAALQYFLYKNLPHGWIWLFLVIGISGGGYVAMLLITRYMDREEQKWLRSFVSRLVFNV